MNSQNTNKIDWVRKFTSRKLWLAIANFVMMLLIAYGKPESVATQVSALIMAGATVIAYIIGEGLTDAAHNTLVDTITADAIEDKEAEDADSKD